MSEFFVYSKMGFEHISEIRGYDHMLFIFVLCAAYQVAEWKKIMLLVTAFTLGHSITLALSALQFIKVSVYWIEVLIPVTIFATSLHNVWRANSNQSSIWHRYLLTLFFGLIHGMGFSNFFNTLMGDTSQVLLPLFAFNAGLEIGQLVIVTCFYLLFILSEKIFNFKHRDWCLFISGAGAGVSLILILERY